MDEQGSRRARYEIRRDVLDRAAARAAGGLSEKVVVSRPTVRNPSARGGAGSVALARAAQERWWLGLLGRLDASLDDDLAAMPPAARAAIVRDAWEEQNREMPGYIALAEAGAGDPDLDADRLRYRRLLALFAGRANIDDRDEDAAAAGLRLLAELPGMPGSRPASTGESDGRLRRRPRAMPAVLSGRASVARPGPRPRPGHPGISRPGAGGRDARPARHLPVRKAAVARRTRRRSGRL